MSGPFKSHIKVYTFYDIQIYLLYQPKELTGRPVLSVRSIPGPPAKHPNGSRNKSSRRGRVGYSGRGVGVSNTVDFSMEVSNDGRGFPH